MQSELHVCINNDDFKILLSFLSPLDKLNLSLCSKSTQSFVIDNDDSVFSKLMSLRLFLRSQIFVPFNYFNYEGSQLPNLPFFVSPCECLNFVIDTNKQVVISHSFDCNSTFHHVNYSIPVHLSISKSKLYFFFKSLQKRGSVVYEFDKYTMMRRILENLNLNYCNFKFWGNHFSYVQNTDMIVREFQSDSIVGTFHQPDPKFICSGFGYYGSTHIWGTVAYYACIPDHNTIRVLDLRREISHTLRVKTKIHNTNIFIIDNDIIYVDHVPHGIQLKKYNLANKKHHTTDVLITKLGHPYFTSHVHFLSNTFLRISKDGQNRWMDISQLWVLCKKNDFVEIHKTESLFFIE